MSDDSPYLLTEVTLRAFKAAYEPKPIALRPFNVIIGRNGSGKSTLLEALQWMDTAIRRDVREALDRYRGIQDVVNLRSQDAVPGFEFALSWDTREPSAAFSPLRYSVRVEANNRAVRIAHESLTLLTGGESSGEELIGRGSQGGRLVFVGGDPDSGALLTTMSEPDRLALAWWSNFPSTNFGELQNVFVWRASIREFWRRAVFLRLSPSRLQEGSSATRRSFEPLLDEEGHNLPALLGELLDDQRASLVAAISDILPDIRDVEVSKPEHGRDTSVNYSLLEEMPYQGREGKKQFPIPAWMLSEGTRRITAILALLMREPAPSLLCIEEIENGLDPWTVKIILRHLQDAADRGTQVLLTTHSPWVLDDVPMESILLVRRRGGDTQYEHFASLDEVKAFNDSVPAGTRYVNLQQE